MDERSLLHEARAYVLSFASLTKHPTAPADANNLVCRIDAVLQRRPEESQPKPDLESIQLRDSHWTANYRLAHPSDGYGRAAMDRRTLLAEITRLKG